MNNFKEPKKILDKAVSKSRIIGSKAIEKSLKFGQDTYAKSRKFGSKLVSKSSALVEEASELKIRFKKALPQAKLVLKTIVSADKKTNETLDAQTTDEEVTKETGAIGGVVPWEGSSVFVEQGRHWSSALIWISAGLFGSTILWAFTARIDQTVSVRGRLEPSGSVKKIESPSSGVVRKVFVREGQLVQAGQPLMDVEAKGLASRRRALEQSLRMLELQALALDAIIASDGDPARLGPLPQLPLVDDPDLYNKLITARNQTKQLSATIEQLDTRIESMKESYRLQTQIAKDLKPLYEVGAMARNSYLNQLNKVQELRAQVASLMEDKIRIIGTANSQLNQVNRQQITLRSELDTVKEAISYRTILSPIDGTVFDAKVAPYSVVNPSQVLLKIVPDNLLQAKVNVMNSDIGFLKVGMPASVTVDSFPSGEFGYIKGKLTSLGSDALPPDQTSNQYRFPAIISLKEQTVQAGKEELNLQSGMGVTANIKLRTRPAITIITDMFTKQFEGIKKFR